MALSVDDAATSTKLVDKLGLNFPIAHGADVDKVAAALDAYVNDDPRHLQATGFVLAPDGTVVTAVYSSGPVGRLVADDVVALVHHIKGQS